ncbi:cation:proton antiporter [Granulicella tundricola]|uniref:Sodium/hydrogen exchanger n=1 Tax=Granulicella tundricola (strain ATCC BAA-1859 / DSM 23138 / MP5ACTX9) TaxID=1198114 RepID=E8X5P1_GRATM|nr:sodium:proton antiporter [Granulicella tundricola]ADW70668.1 sodium/hydrogen exchanger [Granulicella tundricola MP5ACTX9]
MSRLELFSILVTTAALFGWASRRWLKLPLTIGTMVLTVAAALGLLGLDQIIPAHLIPGLHPWALHLLGEIDFENLILHGMLGLLLFAGAFLLDLEALAKEKLAVALLSLPGTLLSFLATAALMHWLLPLLGMQAPWLPCLFFGALISPTDPIAVLEMLGRAGVSRNLKAQLAGESLFNDGVGAVLFIALLEVSRGTIASPIHFILLQVFKAAAGLALGVLASWFSSWMMSQVDAYQVEILFTISLAVGTYALAERLHVSAPLTAVAAGIALRHFNLRHHHDDISHTRLDRFWEVIDEVQNAILFVLLGLEILAIPFTRLSLESGLVAIVSVSVVRFAVVAAILMLLRLLQPSHQSSIRTLTWGGLRGGLALALALAVPAHQGRAWILVATYSLILFSIVFQGGSMDVILGRVARKQGREPRA